MCKHIFLILAAAVVAHLMPKQTLYTFQGVALANSTVEWSPAYRDLNGMFFFQALGKHTLMYDNTRIHVDGHAFFHTRGPMPEMYCESEEVCKVVAHLIT
jgi:hypothetical protein